VTKEFIAMLWVQYLSGLADQPFYTVIGTCVVVYALCVVANTINAIAHTNKG
jgi:hypothetical protein